MDDFKFKSLEELYRKLLPALRCKCNDLKRNGISYILEEDVWEYLRLSKWCKKCNLTLGEMVNDILWVNNEEFKKYKNEQLLNKVSTIKQDVL